jgi:uncharacterized 2Fe-2S/4Fe-4S cluster protein (DUF4445 family)
MSDQVRIKLLPLEHEFTVRRGTPLQDVLFPYGVEFPCGGNGICEGCKIKVLAGHLPLTPEQDLMLSRKEVSEGWRLACRCRADEDLTIELAQWEARVLTDDSDFEFTAREGLGVAIDLGTTTLAAQLLDLQSGNVLGVSTGLNEQGRHGNDVMTRVFYAVEEHGQPELEKIIRTQLGTMIGSLIENSHADGARVRDIAIVGNTVMHHLFSGRDVGPLSQYPFHPPNIGMAEFSSLELGWSMVPNARVRFLPCMGSFVGSDIIAGVLATNLHKSETLAALIDLGTNGEIVVGSKEKLLFCSTAAGPAFEGSCISMGMRATTGAIAQVVRENGSFKCRVLGNVEPKGICGSGLVDAVAAGLQSGLIREDGNIMSGTGKLSLCPPVELNQVDIRELQVAKGAIAAGFRILAKNLGASIEDIGKVYLAGAFGNYIDRANAYRIGLLPVPPERIQPVGNSALLGAKLSLFHVGTDVLSQINAIASHVELNLDEEFQDIFVGEMGFPDPSNPANPG